MASPLLRVHAHAALACAPPHLCDLRVLLVADVLLRTAALGGRQALVGLGLPDDAAPADVKALSRDADLLGVHPPAARTGHRDIPAELGGPVGVHVAGHATPAAELTGGARFEVGPATGPAPTDTDPAALRLALLSHAPAEPAGLTPGGLAEAARTLAHWRGRVADWAREPSRPADAATVREARTRYSDGLDTPAVLGLLRRLDQADEVPAGARFETFVHLDRVLALELARDVGR